MERSRLSDPACPSVLVSVSFESATIGVNNEDARKYMTKMIQIDEIEDHLTGVYEINFTGTFVYTENKRPHVSIYAHHVWSFKRVPCTAFYIANQCEAP
jgi:hypothetical protein